MLVSILFVDALLCMILLYEIWSCIHIHAVNANKGVKHWVAWVVYKKDFKQITSMTLGLNKNVMLFLPQGGGVQNHSFKNM